MFIEHTNTFYEHTTLPLPADADATATAYVILFSKNC